MTKYIDVHSRLGPGRPHETRPVDQALREMDAAGFERAWVCPTEAFTAVDNRQGNDFIAQALALHPDRFIGCAVSNPWYGKTAVTELRRAFHSGLRVLYLCPPVQGFQLSDELVDPLLNVALEFSAPVYAHTGTPVCAMPFQLAALARRHPGIKFIMGHMGFADFWYDAVPAARSADNIWLETSLIDDTIIIEAIEKIGIERVLFGSAAPLSALLPEVEKIQTLPLPRESIEKILRINAERILP
ncbi:MAG: amidohydrolase family protein [Phycisphaerae bacterium]